MQIINPLQYPGWDELLFSHPSYSFFHSSAWANVLWDTYHYRPVYFAQIEDHKIATLIPLMEVNSILTGKRGVSLPFSDYCEPIIQNRKTICDYLEFLEAYGKRCHWHRIEFRGAETSPEIQPCHHYFIHTLMLSENENEIFKNFRNSNKRNIKKAAGSAVETQIETGYESIKIFYTLHCITRKRQGVPPQPFRFFSKIYEHIIAKNQGAVVVAYHKGIAVSAAVFFHYRKKVIYKFGASNYNYQHLRVNNLVMWEAIKWYGRKGFQQFCFGRTSPENKGLLQFKSGWGAKESTLNYYNYNLHKNRFIGVKPKRNLWVNRVFKKMPMVVLRSVGAALYPHIG